MGRGLIEAICADDRFNLAGALVRRGSAAEGRDAGTVAGLREVGVAAGSELPECDVVIDFSTPAGLVILLAGWMADRRGRRMIAAVSLAVGSSTAAVFFRVEGTALWVSAALQTIASR